MRCKLKFEYGARPPSISSIMSDWVAVSAFAVAIHAFLCGLPYKSMLQIDVKVIKRATFRLIGTSEHVANNEDFCMLKQIAQTKQIQWVTFCFGCNCGSSCRMQLCPCVLLFVK